MPLPETRIRVSLYSMDRSRSARSLRNSTSRSACTSGILSVDFRPCVLVLMSSIHLQPTAGARSAAIRMSRRDRMGTPSSPLAASRCGIAKPQAAAISHPPEYAEDFGLNRGHLLVAQLRIDHV